MAPRFLWLVACLFISLQGRTQIDLSDPLGSAFRVSAQSKLRQALPAHTCAVIFSGGLIAFDDEGQFPQAFTVDPDFYYLTGMRVPDAAIVVFAEPQNLTEGSVNSILFLPDKTDYGLVSMGYDYRGKFGLQEGGIAIRQAGLFRKFCSEILSQDAVEKIYSKPIRLSTFQKPGAKDYWDLSYDMFTALAPGFAFDPVAQKYYKEIMAVDSVAAPALAVRIGARLEYESIILHDPILERFAKITRLAALRSLQDELRRVKIDLLQFECCLRAKALLKSDAELAAIKKSIAILNEAMKIATSRMTAGRSEAAILAAAEYTVRLRSATLPMPTRVASGKHSAQPNFVTQFAALPKTGAVVMDLAVAHDGYAARATRTVPIGGSFGADLLPLYEGVRAIHQKSIHACLAHVAPSKIQTTAAASFDALDKTQIFSTNALGARKVLKVTSLVPIGLALEEGPLGSSLQAGQVICIETALYLPDEDGVTAKWRGTGIVLRDMVLIEDGGPKWLTEGIPSDVAGLAALVSMPIPLPEE